MRKINQATVNQINEATGKNWTYDPSLKLQPSNSPEPFNWVKWGIVGLGVILIVVLLARKN